MSLHLFRALADLLTVNSEALQHARDWKGQFVLHDPNSQNKTFQPQKAWYPLGVYLLSLWLEHLSGNESNLVPGVAAVDTGFKSARSAEKTFTLDASCVFNIAASSSSSSAGGGTLWKIPKVYPR